jgi:NTE family protein
VTRLELSAGRNLGLVGQVRLGWREERHQFRIETGLPLIATDPFRISGVQASLELDQKNQLFVSSQGWSAKAGWFESADGSHNLLTLGLDGATQMNGWVLGLRGSYAGSTYGVLPGQEVAKLGGFLNLSGFANDQLSGDKVSYAHVRAERILGQMPMGLRGDLRAGIALEAGRIGRPLSEPQRTGTLDSAVIYVRAETPFGPGYIGLGRSSSGPVNAYFFIGTP